MLNSNDFRISMLLNIVIRNLICPCLFLYNQFLLEERGLNQKLLSLLCKTSQNQAIGRMSRVFANGLGQGSIPG